MASSSNGVSPHDSVGMWLKRLATLAAVVLLGFCSWFVWRISMVAYQMESAIVAISADVKQMSSTGAQISDHLQKLDVRLQAIEEKAADAMNLDEMAHILDEVDAIRGSQGSSESTLSAGAEREIKHLLRQIRRSDHRFTYSDENKGGTRFYFQLYAKYKTYEKLISSAEDFIEKAATTSIGGHPYQVVLDEGKTVALNDWLTDELKKFRQSGNDSTREE